MRLALTAGWRDVAVAHPRNLPAHALLTNASKLGQTLLLAAAPSVRLGVYLLGGAYLIWVGLRLVHAGLRRSRPHENSAADSSSGIAPASSAQPSEAGGTSGPFMQGVLTALANVQALFFLSSIFAGVGILRANLATGLAAVGIIVVGNGAYLSLLAWALQRERPRAFYARFRPAMEIGFGLIFTAFGLRLVWREAAGWL
jgi:threonine/homoserine/homoserine lactone efflux protein